MQHSVTGTMDIGAFNYEMICAKIEWMYKWNTI